MKLRNKYYMLRHGEALSNARDIMSSWPEKFENPLTENGITAIEGAAEILKGKNIDLIFSSDVLRAKQTAQIVAKALGLEIVFDERLREIDFGGFNGKNISELKELVDGDLDMPSDQIKEIKRRIKPGGKIAGYGAAGGEDYIDALRRVGDFFNEIDARYQHKNILIVSHQSPLYLLEEKVKGIGLMQIGKTIPGYWQIHKGEVRELTAEIKQAPLVP